MARRPRGFTLIELLVVVAIIVVLIAVLLPSLGRAREQAKMILCAADMRQVGQLVNIFAGENDGRSPGGGARGFPDNDGSSYAWCDILDMVTLQNTNGNYSNDSNHPNNAYGIAGRYDGPNPRTLSCPDFVVLGYNCSYAYNVYASGGTESDPRADPRGNPYYTVTYGLPIYPPESVNSAWDTHGMSAGAMGKYWLGAKLSRFNSSDFMLVEFDHANPTTDGSVTGSTSKGSVVLLGNGAATQGYQPYDSAGGSFSFRHPYMKRANFLCFDGHVEPHTPTDNISAEGNAHFLLPN